MTFLLLSKYEIEATQSEAICRVGFFLHRGEKKSTQCAIGNPEGPQETTKWERRRGKKKVGVFFDMQLFDDDGGGGSAVGEGDRIRNRERTAREPFSQLGFLFTWVEDIP